MNVYNEETKNLNNWISEYSTVKVKLQKCTTMGLRVSPNFMYILLKLWYQYYIIRTSVYCSYRPPPANGFSVFLFLVVATYANCTIVFLVVATYANGSSNLCKLYHSLFVLGSTNLCNLYHRTIELYHSLSW